MLWRHSNSLHGPETRLASSALPVKKCAWFVFVRYNPQYPQTSVAKCGFDWFVHGGEITLFFHAD